MGALFISLRWEGDSRGSGLASGWTMATKFLGVARRGRFAAETARAPRGGDYGGFSWAYRILLWATRNSR